MRSWQILLLTVSLLISPVWSLLNTHRNFYLHSRHKLALLLQTHQSDDSSTVSVRIFSIEVPLSLDPGKDHHTAHDALMKAIESKLLKSSNSRLSKNLKEKETLTILKKSEDVEVVRKSFDGRLRNKDEPCFVYTVDLKLPPTIASKLKFEDGKIERNTWDTQEPIVRVDNQKTLPAVVVVGSGPAGLFAALTLVERGYKPIIIERGKPVEERGKDIGALFNRRILNPESNLCYGEGGAGTWSDGKLTTRIGKNSESVRYVLKTLVRHGAPEKILVDGKPHLGTDKLVVILRNLRKYMISLGATFCFQKKVVDFTFSNTSSEGKVMKAVILDSGESIPADIVVLAVGHSSRQLYERLIERGIYLEPKDIAVGFRIEHPQDLINRIQYGKFSDQVDNGKGRIPVADYRLATEVPTDSEIGRAFEKVYFTPSSSAEDGNRNRGSTETEKNKATTKACYSFCMCPGGQVVPTSVKTDELCVNGMSFSRRQSKWANSALVVNVNTEDMIELGGTGPLRGMVWQQAIEARAAALAGDGLTVPVQRVTDFLEGRDYTPGPGDVYPTSSYRLGVKPSPLHSVYPSYITKAICNALRDFDRRMPGYITPEALLHGVETRTSSPVRIVRDDDTLEALGIKGLFPSGEGAGYAGGIVSAAVDGLRVAKAIDKLVHPDLYTAKVTDGNEIKRIKKEKISSMY